MAAQNIGPRIGIDGMAEYRRSLNQIIQQGKELASEMKAVSSAYDKSDKSQAAMAAKAGVLTKQIENQRARVETLTTIYGAQRTRLEELQKALADATQKYGANSKEAEAAAAAVDKQAAATSKAKTELNNATAALNSMEGQMRQLSDATDDTGEALDDAGKNAVDFGDLLKANVLGQAIVKGAEKLAVAIKKLGQAMADTIRESAAYADDILTLSTNTGLSTDALQEYKYMAQLTDTSLETITGSLVKLTRNMSSAKNGTGSAAEAFETLGVNIKDSNGELRNNQDVFADTLEALGNMSNETERDALAMTIFGKSAQDLNSFMAAGADGVAALAQEAHDMGYVLDNDTLHSLGAVDDAMQRATNMVTSVKNQIGAGLAPTVVDIAEKMQAWADSVDWSEVGAKVAEFANAVKDFGAFVVENGAAIAAIIGAIGAGFVGWNVAAMITGVVKSINTFTAALSAGKTVFAALNVTMAANPIGLVVAAVAALTAGLVILWNTNEGFRNTIINVWTAFKNTILGAINAAVSAFDRFRSSVIDNARAAGQAIVDGVGSGVEFLRGLPGQALRWGKDMIEGFARGIRNAMGAITGAVKGVAESIRSRLHFSRPDTGPLRNYETWMPDMIDGMVAGIEANAWKLQNAVDAMAGGMVVNGGGNVGVSAAGGYGPVTIQVYGAAGQDVNALANIVMQKINTATMQKQGVW